jgi:hypothetical protein
VAHPPERTVQIPDLEWNDANVAWQNHISVHDGNPPVTTNRIEPDFNSCVLGKLRRIGGELVGYHNVSKSIARHRRLGIFWSGHDDNSIEVLSVRR